MPVKVTLIPDDVSYLDPNSATTEQVFVVKDRKDYAKIGFAAARWARESVRNARMREGEDFAELRMAIDFLGEEEPEPPEKQAGKRRRKKGKSNGAAE